MTPLPTPRFPARAGLALTLCVAAGACGVLHPPRVYMINEDSHPHEVRPGTAARFHVPAVAAPRKMDVKCALDGPAGPVRLEFSGITPEGWAVAHPRFHVGGRELSVDIEGIVRPDHPTPYFAFLNDDPTRLLWHQCYNN